MLVFRGRYVQGHLNWDGEYVLGADHRQVAQLLRHIARQFRIAVRWYGSVKVRSLAVAMPEHGAITIDENIADTLVVLHGEVALLFPVLHEVGHLRHSNLAGRAGERAADSFATYALLVLGYEPSQILRGAAVTLAGAGGDDVHDAGWQRLDLVESVIEGVIASRARLSYSSLTH